MKKIKLISVILALVLMISCFAACGGNTETPTNTATDATNATDEATTIEITTEEFSTVPAGTKLVMGSSCDFPPYEYVGAAANEFVGIDIEIAQGFCEKYGYELEVSNMKFDSIIAAVNTDAVDFGMSGFTITEKRKESVNFSDPYQQTFQAILVKEGSEIKGKEDLAGKSIGVQAGTTGDDFVTADFKDDPNTTINKYDLYSQAVQALLSDMVDCVVLDDATADSFAAENEGLVKLEGSYGDEQYAAIFNFDDTELLNQFNTYLAEIKASGALQNIFDKYLGANAPEEATEAAEEATEAAEEATEAAEEATEAAEEDTEAAEEDTEAADETTEAAA